MLRKLAVICICLSSVFAFSQSATKSKYRIATVLAVSPHDSTTAADSSTASYDVSVKIGNTVYVVLYTPPLGMQNAKYAAGAEVVVLVGEKTITYNDISGSSVEVPILRRKTLAAAGVR
jgi:hypothetical protein